MKPLQAYLELYPGGTLAAGGPGSPPVASCGVADMLHGSGGGDSGARLRATAQQAWASGQAKAVAISQPASVVLSNCTSPGPGDAGGVTATHPMATDNTYFHVLLPVYLNTSRLTGGLPLPECGDYCTDVAGRGRFWGFVVACLNVHEVLTHNENDR